MNKEQLMALGMDEQMARKAAEAFAEELKGYVPKARFNELLAERDAAREDKGKLEGQLEELKKTAGDNNALKEQIEQLQKDNEAEADRHAAELHALKVDNAVSLALTEARALNQKAVKALLNLEKAEFDADGKVKGLSEQIKALIEAEDSKFLFGAPTKPAKGAKMGEPGDGKPGGKELNAMSYDELCAYLEANPGAQLN